MFDFSANTSGGTAITVTATGDTIKGGTFQNMYNASDDTQGVGILAEGITGLTVNGITAWNVNNAVVCDYGCANDTVENSDLQGRGNSVVKLESSETGAEAFDSNVVTRTTIRQEVKTDASGGTDGIEAYNGLTADHDQFIATTLAGSTSTQHPDEIQLQGNWAKIYDNTFTNVGDSDVDMDDFANANDHDVYIYNNVFQVQTVIDPYPDLVRIYHSSGSISTLNNIVIANNLFVDAVGQSPIPPVNLCYYEDCSSATGSNDKVVNNEFIGLGPANSDSVYARGPWTFDHNVYAGGGGHVFYHGTDYTFAAFTISVDTTGIVGLPAFVGYSPNATTNDFHLSAADTISANTGVSLAPLFTTDHDDVTRPQGSAWDRGPFERVGG